MRNLTATLCLTIAVLLGSVGVSWSAEPIKGFCLSWTKHSHLTIAGKCSSAYEKGDYATALREWKPLAKQGNADAQFNLGHVYRRGQGVPKNYKTAVKWYRLAAEQGYANAQGNLGLMYALGDGVAADYMPAYMWLKIAASSGNKLAIKNIDAIAKRMTPTDISTAQKLARECVRKKYKGC